MEGGYGEWGPKYFYGSELLVKRDLGVYERFGIFQGYEKDTGIFLGYCINFFHQLKSTITKLCTIYCWWGIFWGNIAKKKPGFFGVDKF